MQHGLDSGRTAAADMWQLCLCAGAGGSISSPRLSGREEVHAADEGRIQQTEITRGCGVLLAVHEDSEA